MFKIAFIGLGNMGIGMAQNLINAKYQLNIYNRTQEKADGLTGDFKIFDQPNKAVADVDMVVTMLSDDETLLSLANGNHGFLTAMKKDAIHISMSTISPDTSRELYNMHKVNG